MIFKDFMSLPWDVPGTGDIGRCGVRSRGNRGSVGHGDGGGGGGGGEEYD